MIKHISPAKVNLTLDILGREPNGYHRLQTVIMEYPELHDIVEIDFATQDKVETAGVSQTENLAYKALLLFKKHFKIQQNFQIKITKNIPISSGLGGGSSNAATVLKALNQITKKNASQAELAKLAEQIGMDVPFFIYGGTCFCTGYGEKVERLPDAKIKIQVHAKGADKKQKTASSFAALDLAKCGKNTAYTEKLLQLIKNGTELAAHEELFHNDFQQLYPNKKAPHLSGCGPSRFKILNSAF